MKCEQRQEAWQPMYGCPVKTIRITSKLCSIFFFTYNAFLLFLKLQVIWGYWSKTQCKFSKYEIHIER